MRNERDDVGLAARLQAEIEVMIAGLPRWLRIALVAAFGFLSFGICYAGYRYAVRPTTLTVATGSLDGDVGRLMSAIAARLASSRSQVRFKVVEKPTILEATGAFSKGDVDLVLARPDVGDLKDARTIVLLAYAVVIVLAPPASGIDTMADLKGKVIGVVGGETNRRVADTLDREYELTRNKARFRDLALAEVQPALASRQIHALLVVTPMTEKYLGMIKSGFPSSGKRNVKIIAIDAADAIADIAKAYESYELPKGAVRGTPPIPDDDVTTLRMPLYLLGNKKLSDDIAGELAKVIMDTRRELVGDFPVLAQIAAPSTDSDAFIPAHPGAKAYFDGEQKTFFDKYGDQIFYGSMALGSLTSLLAALWKFMGFGPGGASRPLGGLYEYAPRIRAAATEAELATIAADIDESFEKQLAATGADDRSTDVIVLCLTTLRLDQLIHVRYTILTSRGGGPSERPASP
jgi:TRAP-type uncharacterized transport system substrate-binding protein